MSSPIAGIVPSASDISGLNVLLTGTSIVTVSGNQVFISGQAVAISGSMVSISGQPVRVSGQTIRVQAFDPSGQTYNDLIVNQSGGNVLRVDAGAINVASNVSGNVVYLTSGQNAVQNSGQTIYLTSGKNDVQISGQAVLISGQTVVASVTTNISGQVVYTASGNNEVAVLGYDSSLDVLRRVRVTASGQGVSGLQHKLLVTFSGESIIGSVSGNMVSVSGQPVSVSGNAVTISGQAVLISGQTIRLVSGFNRIDFIDQSGNSLGPLIDDNTVQADTDAFGSNAMPAAAYIRGYIQASGSWARIRITQSGQGISGIPYKLVVTFSGDSIIGSVSGNMVSISGQPVAGSVSGNMVSISGQPISVSGNMVSVSGQPQTISGNVVEPMSGGSVRLNGLDLSGNQWLPLRLSESGRNTLVVNIASNTNNSSVYAAVGSANTDLGSLNNQLRTNAMLIGYDSTVDAGVRVRVTASGQGISGVTNKLIVTFSGDPITVSGNMVSISGQAISVSGNALAISGQTIRPQLLDLSGNVYRDMVSPSSGSQALVTSTATPPTFIAYADNVVPASGGIAFAMEYRSGGSTVVLKKMFITNIEPALISGQYIRYDICRISGLYSGATQITAFPHDPNDGKSGASLNIEANVTGSLFPTAARDLLIPWTTMTNGWAISGGQGPPLRNDAMQQTMNVLPESPEMKEIRMTSGFGIILQQTLAQTGYTQVTSGRFGITVVYTIQ